MFAHQNILVECFAVVFLVLLLDSFHVDFRAAHHDAGQGMFTSPFALIVTNNQSEMVLEKYWHAVFLIIFNVIVFLGFFKKHTVPPWLHGASQQSTQTCFQHTSLWTF